MTAAAVVTGAMNETEARALTERIKTSVEHVWNLLLEAHERKAWKALGYESWRAYGCGELGYSQSHCYRLLDQAKVISEIESVTGISPHGEIDEKTARDIKPRIAEVTEKIRERVDSGEAPETVVADVVAAARPKPAEPKGKPWSRSQGNPERVIANVVSNLKVLAESIVGLEVDDAAATPEQIAELDRVIGALRKFRNRISK